MLQGPVTSEFQNQKQFLRVQFLAKLGSRFCFTILYNQCYGKKSTIATRLRFEIVQKTSLTLKNRISAIFHLLSAFVFLRKEEFVSNARTIGSFLREQKPVADSRQSR